MNLLTLEKCFEYEKMGWLDKHESADGKLIGFKYSLQTVYDHAWDEITLQCRGIVFEKSTGAIVAHPFNKFFNAEEIWTEEKKLAEVGKILDSLGHGFEPNSTREFYAMDKIDGSLGILFYYNRKWIIKTGGSFDSEQAKWAQKWFDKNIDQKKLVKGWTYCFEIVWDGDPHVCHYDYEGLVLLGFFDQVHRESLPGDMIKVAEELGVRYAESIPFYTYDEMVSYARGLDVDHEGFVVTFRSGFKVKVKGLAYLSRFHLISGITKRDVRSHFDVEKLQVDPEYKSAIPEECPKMKQYAEELEQECQSLYRDVQNVCSKISGLTGRVRYETAIEEGGSLTGSLAVQVANGKKVNDRIFRHVVDRLKKRDKEDDDLL